MTRLVALACIGAAASTACGGDRVATPTPPEASASALPDPTSREPGCALGEGALRHAGRAPAIAAGALVVQFGDAAALVSPDDPTGATRSLGRLRVPPSGLASRADGWIAAAQTEEGPAAILFGAADGAVDRIPLDAARALTDAAVAVAGDRAWIAWRDTDGRVRLSLVDLLSGRLVRTLSLADAPAAGALRAAATARAVYVTVVGGGSVWALDAGGARPRRAVAPGVPHDLLPEPHGVAIVHDTADRTGAWLAHRNEASIDSPVDGSAAAGERATHPRAQPEDISAALLPDGAVLVYRSRGDLWAQRLGVGGARGEPMVLGPSGSAPPRVAARGRRFWVAWEDGDETVVRTGACLAVDPSP